MLDSGHWPYTDHFDSSNDSACKKFVSMKFIVLNTQLNTTEDSHLHTHCHKKLRSQLNNIPI
jgi:hypothetical protein